MRNFWGSRKQVWETIFSFFSFFLSFFLFFCLSFMSIRLMQIINSNNFKVICNKQVLAYLSTYLPILQSLSRGLKQTWLERKKKNIAALHNKSWITSNWAFANCLATWVKGHKITIVIVLYLYLYLWKLLKVITFV
jgi:hypothetical protein